MRKQAPVIWQVRSEARSLDVTECLRRSAENVAAGVGMGRSVYRKSEFGEGELKVEGRVN